MIKSISYIFSFFLFVGCIPLKKEFVEYGEYGKKGKDFEYSLKLNADNTFILKQEFSLYGSSECEGIWSYNELDTLLLQCNEEDIINSLSSNYMPRREWRVKVINKKRIQVDSVVLRLK